MVAYSVPGTCLKPLDYRNSRKKVEFEQLLPAVTVVSRLANGTSNTCLRHRKKRFHSKTACDAGRMEDGRCQKATSRGRPEHPVLKVHIQRNILLSILRELFVLISMVRSVFSSVL